MIFGHWGFPEMGFNGAAVASVISECIGMCTVMFIIYSLDIKKISDHSGFQYRFQKLKLVFTQGFPLMSQLAISTASWWVFLFL